MLKTRRRIAEKPTPLTFHQIYGKGVSMSNNNRQATRTSGFGDAIVFSSRPVRTFEKVFLKHRKKDVDWLGSLRIGFCLSDPQTKFTQETLPQLAFKNLTDVAGYYLRACPDEILRNSPIIYVYYSYDGQIHIGGCSVPTSDQVILTIAEHSGPYYLFCEIYGRTDQIEIIDETTLPNQISTDSNIYSQNLHVSKLVEFKLKNNEYLAQLQYFKYLFAPNTQHRLTFLPTNTQNIVTITNHRIVCVNDLKISASYAFICTAMRPGDMLICRILDYDTNISSVLLFGLTTCRPESIKNDELPMETNDLIRKYSSVKWLIESDINVNLNLFDELAFWFNVQGQVYLSVNSRTPTQLKNITIPSADLNQSTLYPFFDLCGQITSLCLYNYVNQSQFIANNHSNALKICSICYENLGNTQLLPCECIVCHQCAAILKQANSFSNCPFDRKHILRTQILSE